MEILGVFILLGIIFILYLASSYENNHDRQMRRIKECQEDRRKDNNEIITPENISNYSENLSSTNINKDLPSEENLKLTEEEKENLRTWIAGPKKYRGGIKDAYLKAYESGNPKDLPKRARRKWTQWIYLSKRSSGINTAKTDTSYPRRGKRGGRYYLVKSKITGKYYRQYY